MTDQASTIELAWLGETLSPAARLLATEFSARAIGAAALKAQLADGRSRRHVAATGALARDALSIAVDHAARIETVTLVAPPSLASLDASLVDKLKSFEAQTLVLFGTSSAQSAPELTTAWRRALPKCHLYFVYDTDARPDEERPEAVAAVVADFLRRKDGFLVRAEDGRVHP